MVCVCVCLCVCVSVCTALYVSLQLAWHRHFIPTSHAVTAALLLLVTVPLYWIAAWGYVSAAGRWVTIVVHGMYICSIQIGALKRTSKGAPIVLLDKNGSSSKAVAKELAKMGFGQVCLHALPYWLTGHKSLAMSLVIAI